MLLAKICKKSLLLGKILANAYLNVSDAAVIFSRSIVELTNASLSKFEPEELFSFRDLDPLNAA